jgi:uncharacterized protein YbcI
VKPRCRERHDPSHRKPFGAKQITGASERIARTYRWGEHGPTLLEQEMRHDFQRMMTKRFKETIEELTGRNVVAFLSQAHVEPDITIEMFFIDGPLEGFGAIEITDVA